MRRGRAGTALNTTVHAAPEAGASLRPTTTTSVATATGETPPSIHFRIAPLHATRQGATRRVRKGSSRHPAEHSHRQASASPSAILSARRLYPPPHTRRPTPCWSRHAHTATRRQARLLPSRHTAASSGAPFHMPCPLWLSGAEGGAGSDRDHNSCSNPCSHPTEHVMTVGGGYRKGP